MLNTYELQYVALGHLAGILTFQLFAFDRDSLVETGKCPTKAEINGYSAYQIMADDMVSALLLLTSFFASFGLTSFRMLTKRNRSAFDLVSFTQHLLLAMGFIRNAFTLREINTAGPIPSEVFQCKTVMMFAMSHLGQLGIQVFTMLLLNHFAYDEAQRGISRDKKRALTLYMLSYILVGFLSGYYSIFTIMFDRITLLSPALVTVPKIVKLQHTYSAVLTAPPVFMLAAPLALMWSMMLSVIRWSIWRSRIEVSAFVTCCFIGLAMAFDYLILGQETLAVEVSDIHTSDELMGFFRITAYMHGLISFVFCPLLCLITSRSQVQNEPRFAEIRFVGREMKPPTPLDEHRAGKTVKAA